MRIQRTNLTLAMIATVVATMTTGCLTETLLEDGSAITAEDDEDGKGDSTSRVSTYFSARRDTRRCISPLCGGIWVKRSNQATTRCVDGVLRSECYVPTASFSALSATESETAYLNDRLAGNRLIVRARLASKDYPNFGNLGVLNVTEAWDSATDSDPTDTFFAVRASGIVCVQEPCPSLRAATLNTTTAENITDLILNAVPNVSEEAIAQAMRDAFASKILVAGAITSQRGSVTLRANQFYLAFARKLELVGDWHAQLTPVDARYDYTFNDNGTFLSYEQPACAFSRPPCLVSIALREGTYSIDRAGTNVHLDYVSAQRLGQTADFVVQGVGTAATLVGRDFGVSLTLTR